MFNRNNKISQQNEGYRPENTEGKAKLNAVYNGKGTQVDFECACNGLDLLNMYASITNAFLNAGITATSLVSAIAAAEAKRMTKEE